MTQESGQPGNTGSDLGRAGRPQHGDNRFRDSLTEILLEFDPGGWDEDPRIDQWADRLRNAVTLPDLDASQYDNLIVETMDQRYNALWLLKQIADLNEEAHRDGWSALGIYSGITALLKKGGTA